jgi:epsilon-lactone hydrolase
MPTSASPVTSPLRSDAVSSASTTASLPRSPTRQRWATAPACTEPCSRTFDPRRLAIAGDSAGGGLTIATLVKLRDDGVALPAAAVALSPWVDLEGTGGSMRTNADVDVLVDPTALRQMADLFLAGGDPRDPLAAPLYADLRGLPPLYLQVGGDETLLDDSCRLASRAGAAGVEVRLDVFAEMQHVFQVFVGAMPEADDAVARIGAWLRPRLGL